MTNNIFKKPNKQSYSHNLPIQGLVVRNMAVMCNKRAEGADGVAGTDRAESVTEPGLVARPEAYACH